MTQIMLNLIDASVLSYHSILNYPRWLDIIKLANKFAAILGYIDADCLGTKK